MPGAAWLDENWAASPLVAAALPLLAFSLRRAVDVLVWLPLDRDSSGTATPRARTAAATPTNQSGTRRFDPIRRRATTSVSAAASAAVRAESRVARSAGGGGDATIEAAPRKASTR